MKPNLLIVDDEEHTREGLELALDEKYEVFLASSAEEAFNALDAEKFEVVLTDLRMSGESGMSVIDYAIKHASSPVCACPSEEQCTPSWPQGQFTARPPSPSVVPRGRE